MLYGYAKMNRNKCLTQRSTRNTTDMYSIQYFHVQGSYLVHLSFTQMNTKKAGNTNSLTTFFDQRLCLTIPK